MFYGEGYQVLRRDKTAISSRFKEVNLNLLRVIKMDRHTKHTHKLLITINLFFFNKSYKFRKRLMM